MTIAKTILKKTPREVIIKVTGAATDTTTLDLDGSDLTASTEVAGTAGTQVVNIAGLQWTGANGGLITITRNSKIITQLQTGAAGALEMNGQMMVPDSQENTSDIVVTFTNAAGELWVKLHKGDGWSTKIQPEQYGIYDDETSISA